MSKNFRHNHWTNQDKGLVWRLGGLSIEACITSRGSEVREPLSIASILVKPRNGIVPNRHRQAEGIVVSMVSWPSIAERYSNSPHRTVTVPHRSHPSVVKCIDSVGLISMSLPVSAEQYFLVLANLEAVASSRLKSSESSYSTRPDSLVPVAELAHWLICFALDTVIMRNGLLSHAVNQEKGWLGRH